MYLCFRLCIFTCTFTSTYIYIKCIYIYIYVYIYIYTYTYIYIYTYVYAYAYAYAYVYVYVHVYTLFLRQTTFLCRVSARFAVIYQQKRGHFLEPTPCPHGGVIPRRRSDSVAATVTQEQGGYTKKVPPVHDVENVLSTIP